MPNLTEILTSVYGAWRLARFDPQGLAQFAPTMDAYWRSFFAAVLVAPIYALSLLSPRPVAALHVDKVRFGLAEVIGYVLSWVAFPLVMEGLSRRLGCRERYPLYITAYNWSSVIEHAILLPVLVFPLLGIVPDSIIQLLWLGIIVFTVTYAWFVARVALKITSGVAAAIVGLDLLLSYIISIVSGALA